MTGEFDFIYSDLAGDPDMEELIELFADSMQEISKTVAEALDRKDWDGVRRSAHQVKGAAAGYGFANLGSVAATLETMVNRDGTPVETPETIAKQAHDFVDMCDRVRPGHPSNA
ncbi:MAG: Hpt domain-containing protein [Planctomycetota bacterium]